MLIANETMCPDSPLLTPESHLQVTFVQSHSASQDVRSLFPLQKLSLLNHRLPMVTGRRTSHATLHRHMCFEPCPVWCTLPWRNAPCGHSLSDLKGWSHLHHSSVLYTGQSPVKSSMLGIQHSVVTNSLALGTQIVIDPSEFF